MSVIKYIDFPDGKIIDCTLRNGSVNAVGICAMSMGNEQKEVSFMAINSRRKVATGNVGLPVETLPQLINALIEIHLKECPEDEMILREQIEGALQSVPQQALEEEDMDAAHDVMRPGL